MIPAAGVDDYPAKPIDRNQWILGRRGPKNRLDPYRPYAFIWEEEFGPGGELISTATIFLTNSECPYRCLMCDLWKNTLDEPTPVGAIPAQIKYALAQLPSVSQIKLYNSGNFFDPRAIPEGDYPSIADLLTGFDRVIVECHPALLGSRCLLLRDLLSSRLEVAVGLETANPEVLELLNKRLDLAGFIMGAQFLAENDIDLRVFILLKPPFMDEKEGLHWARRSLEVAFENAASVCSIIPTRGENGAMENLRATGAFSPPSLESLEAAQEYGIRLGKGRVFADVWDVEKFYSCACSPSRAARLEAMNRTQKIPVPIACPKCSNSPL